ncbi:MAG: precorrin-3B synthase [Halofilum sp. (in: g-proteobacteria)]
MRVGWCPTAGAAMAAADGLLLRVRPTAGRLTAGALRQLARIAREHGNGAVVLTRRAKVELRGIGDGEAAAAALRAADLAPADPGAEARPDVIVSPATDLDTGADCDIGPVVEALETALPAWPGVRELPAKMALVVDGGGRAHVADSDGDIRFDAVRVGGSIRFRVALAGTRASATPLGYCRAAMLPTVAEGLLATFDVVRRDREDEIWRMRHALAAAGAERFEAAVGDALDADGSEELPAPAMTDGLGAVDGWYGAAFAFGRLDAAALERLAEVAQTQGRGDIRLLPTRRVLVGGAGGQAAAMLREVGAIERADDPRLRLEACSGLGGCTRATTMTRDDALALAAQVPDLLRGEGRCALHVSGCAKSCAYSGAAPVILTGHEGRYDLALNAAPGDEPLWRGLDAAQAGAYVKALEGVLAREGDDTVAALLARLDRDQLRQQVERELTSG